MSSQFSQFSGVFLSFLGCFPCAGGSHSRYIMLFVPHTKYFVKNVTEMSA